MKYHASSSLSRRRRPAHRQDGIALIMSLICLLVLSAMAAGLIVSTQLELWTSSNYRYTTQARYVAEAGAQQAVNWFQQNWTPPSTLSNTADFNLSTFPAKYVGGGSSQNIVFASDNMSMTDTYSNFDSTTDTAFRTTLNNVSVPLPANANFTGSYKVSAQLLSAVKISGNWLTAWKVFSQGNVSGATVQVVQVVRDVMTNGSGTSTAPAFNYAILSTATGCGTIVMSGSGSPRTNAYNSLAAGNVGNASPTSLGSGGNVGSSGNLNIGNGAKILGSFFSPDYNAGAAGTYGISNTASNGMNAGASCSTASGGTIYAVNEDRSGSQVGCSASGSSVTCPDANSGSYGSPPTYNQRTYALPNAYTSMPSAQMPSVTTNTAACNFNSLCNGGTGGSGGCALTLPPSTLPNGQANASGQQNYGAVNFGSCAVITLQAGVYNMDTLLISNGAHVIVPATGNVAINIFNAQGALTPTPLNINGGTVANGGGNPNNLSFIYNGTNTINLNNGNTMFATVYAPNAAVTVAGNQNTYGAIVGKTFNFTGSGEVVYDINLANETTQIPIAVTATPSSLHVDQFSWSAY